MNAKTKIIFCLIYFISHAVLGQYEDYQYKRGIVQISAEWHSIELPNDLFAQLRENLNDIRIVGVKPNADTIEAPYFLRLSKDQRIEKSVPYRLLNKSSKGEHYFLTFEFPTAGAINEIDLDIEQRNFDWRIKLEGSFDQNTWYTILKDYRILSIKNADTDYQFTRLIFPSSNYQFYRVAFKSDEAPKLKGATIKINKITEGSFRNYAIIKQIVHESSNRTIVDIELDMPVPVSHISIDVNDEFDYYRPIKIQYMTDSFKTEKGWKYNFKSLQSGTLSSLEKNEFEFNSTVLCKIKVIIENHDNEPLYIGDCQAKGFSHELIARFNEEADYFLLYGNANASLPKYDIAHFQDNLPEKISHVELGVEEKIDRAKSEDKKPLFENKLWLWAILIFIIILLGFFTLKMIKSE